MTAEVKYRFKSARKLRGLTLREAALRLKMSHQAVDGYEKGRFNIDSEILSKFAKAYNVTTDYLLSNKPELVFGEFHVCKIKY